MLPKTDRPDRQISVPAMCRRRLRVQGIVQGVGFRPFVYGLARRLSLTGFVGNDGDGVFVECEAVSLTRDIPAGLGWLIGPFIESIPRESLEFTLQATRRAVISRKSSQQSAVSSQQAAVSKRQSASSSQQSAASIQRSAFSSQQSAFGKCSDAAG